MIQETTVERTTFAAGEVSPAIRWRRDLAKNQAGVDKLENMVVLVEGGATRRPGTSFVLPFRNEAERAGKLKFELTKTDSILIVVNDRKARFFRDGGYVQASMLPYEIDVPYLADDVGLLRGAQDGNLVYVTCAAANGGAGYRPRILTRFSQTQWTLTDYPVTPQDPQNLDTAKTIIASAVTGGPGVTLIANFDNAFEAADVNTVWRLDEADLNLVALWTSGETGLAVGNQRRYNGNVYRVASIAAGALAGVNPPTHEQGIVLAGAAAVSWEFLHKGFGLFRIDSFTDGRHVAGTVLSRLPDSVTSTATYRWWPSAWSDSKGWPENVQIKQHRLAFFRQDRHWMTVPYDVTNFEVNGQADDAIIGRIRPDDGSLAFVEWALSSGALVAGTRNGEWIFGASGDDDALTATNFDPFQDGSEGSAAHVPALVDGGAVFIGRSGERLHFLKFDRQATKLDIDEITLTARHILKSKATALAFQRDPNRVIWTATATGKLIGFTFMPKESVIAAHRHPMLNCIVEDVVVIPSADGTASDLYLFTRRTINAATRRFIEKLQPFFSPIDIDNPTAEGAWFVDCGLRYQGPPAQTMSGLDHLEGREVAIHADGATHPRRTVAGGAVTLARKASDVIIGEPQPYLLRSLPFETETRKGSSKNDMKQVKVLSLDLVESAGGKVRTNGGTLENIFETGTMDYGAPVLLQTISQKITVSSPTEAEAIVEISGDDTMPMTVAGITPELDMAGA